MGETLRSVPAWRDTLHAEIYERYFDFKQLSISAHVDCFSNLI
jgi:hypothetical protein